MLRILLASTTESPVYSELGQQFASPILNEYASMSSLTNSMDETRSSFGSTTTDDLSTVPDYSEIATICVNSVDGWSAVVDNVSEDIKVSALVPGLSSEVYKVTLLSQGLSVLYRMYSMYGASFYDPSVELSAFKIASTFGLGPRYIASGIGWRIEEFLENFVVMTPPLLSLRSVYLMTATELGKLHRLQTYSTFPSDFKSRSPSVFYRLSSWRDQAVKISTYHMDPAVLRGIDELLLELRAGMESQALGYHVVFSHNDINLGNMMVSKDMTVRLIDFEFADMNFQGSDLAKFFANAPYLSPNDSRDFLREYLCEYLASPFAYDDQVDALQRSLSIFALEYNLMWGLWSVIKSAQEEGGFDFLENAELRFNTYLSLRGKNAIVLV